MIQTGLQHKSSFIAWYFRFLQVVFFSMSPFLLPKTILFRTVPIFYTLFTLLRILLPIVSWHNLNIKALLHLPRIFCNHLILFVYVHVNKINYRNYFMDLDEMLSVGGSFAKNWFNFGNNPKKQHLFMHLQS